MNQPHLHLKCLVQSIIDLEWARLSNVPNKWSSSIQSGRYYLDVRMVTKNRKRHFELMLDNSTRILTFSGIYDAMSGTDHNVSKLTPLGAYKFVVKLINKVYNPEEVAGLLGAAKLKFEDL